MTAVATLIENYRIEELIAAQIIRNDAGNHLS